MYRDRSLTHLAGASDTCVSRRSPVGRIRRPRRGLCTPWHSAGGRSDVMPKATRPISGPIGPPVMAARSASVSATSTIVSHGGRRLAASSIVTTTEPSASRCRLGGQSKAMSRNRHQVSDCPATAVSWWPGGTSVTCAMRHMSGSLGWPPLPSSVICVFSYSVVLLVGIPASMVSTRR